MTRCEREGISAQLDQGLERHAKGSRPMLAPADPAIVTKRAENSAAVARGRELFERLLRSFVPLGCFDFHARLYQRGHGIVLAPADEGRDAGIEFYRKKCALGWETGLQTMVCSFPIGAQLSVGTCAVPVP